MESPRTARNQLKGSDALLLSSFNAFGIRGEIVAIYTGEYEMYDLMSDRIIDLEGYGAVEDSDQVGFMEQEGARRFRPVYCYQLSDQDIGKLNKGLEQFIEKAQWRDRHGEDSEAAEFWDQFDNVRGHKMGQNERTDALVRAKYEDAVNEDKAIYWMTPMTKTNRVETTFITYGNEASTDYIYANLNIVFQFPAASERQITALK